MAEDRNLDTLKQEYKIIQEKYNLPSFDELNRDFAIEKAVEIQTDYLIREIRKLVADRIYNYMRLMEVMMNPQNAPLYIFSLIKTMNEDDKKKLSDIYKKFSDNEIALIKMDIHFDEEKEAEFIKNSYKIWESMKDDILSLIENAEKKLGKEKDSQVKKDYFG
jgi:hypothetical protein